LATVSPKAETMMTRDYTKHECRYEHVTVSLEQIQQIEKETHLRLGASIVSLSIRPKKPAAFEDKYGMNWKEFAGIWAKFPTEVRKYEAVFSREKLTSLSKTVCVQLFVRNQGHLGEPDQKEIILSGYNCHEHDFKVFCKICETLLALKRAPSKPGFNMSHNRLVERVEAIVETPSLLNCIKGPLQASDYDGAIRAAIVLVEDELRKKCLAMGRVEAAAQTGADLSVTAFVEKSGCLNPPWPIATQAREGAHLLFRGFFLYLRNAWGHTSIVVGKDETMVAEHIALCQYLLKVIDKSTKR
jgi:hypothetical protein